MTTDAQNPESEFRLNISAPDFPASAMAQVERWFWFTLGKFEASLRQVDVTLTPAEGGLEGWTVCRIVISDRDGTPSLIEGADQDLNGCIRRTFRRAERSVRRLAHPIRWRVPTNANHAA